MAEDLGTLQVSYAADMSDLISSTGSVEDQFSALAEMADMAAAEMSAALERPVASVDELVAATDAAMSNIEDTFSVVDSGAISMGEAFSNASSFIQESLSSVRSNISSLSESVSSTSSSFLSSVGGMGKGLLDFGSKSGMAVMGMQALWNMAKQGADALLGPAMSAEQMGIAFDNLMGSTKAAKDEIGQLNTFAAKTPFQTMDIDKAAASLIGFGINAQGVVPDLTAIGDALSAVGRATPAEMQSVVDIFGKIQTQGKLTEGDITELGTHGINAWQALANATGKTIPQVKELVAAGLIPAKDGIADLTKGIEDSPLYKGGMAKQANSLSGIMSTLSSNFKLAASNLLGIKDGQVQAGSLFDMVEKGASKLGDVLSSKSFQDFASSTGKNIATTLHDISDIAFQVGEIVRPLGDLFGQLGEKFHFPDMSHFGDGFQNLVNTIEKDLSTVNIGPWIDKFEGFVSNIDFGKIIDGAKQFGGALLNLSPAANLFEALSRHAQDLGHWFDSSVEPAIEKAEPGFENLESALGGLIPAFEDLAGIIHDTFQRAFDGLLPAFESAVPVMIEFGGAISDGLGSAIRFVTPLFEEASGAIGQFAGDIAERVAPILEEFFDNAKHDLEGFETAWNAVWPYLAPVVKSTFDTIEGDVEGVWSILTGVIKVGLDVMGGKWDTAWKDMQDSASGFMHGAQVAAGQSSDQMNTHVSTSAKNMASSVKHSFWDMSTNSIGSMQQMSDTGSRIFEQFRKDGDNSMSNLDSDAQYYVAQLSAYLDEAARKYAQLQEDTAGAQLQRSGQIGGGIRNKNFASGTDYAPGGWSWTGEEGPELMYVPQGAQIIPHDKSMQMASLARAMGANPAPSHNAYPQMVMAGGGNNVTHVHLHLNDQEIASWLIDPMMTQVVKRIRLMGGKMVSI